MVENNGQAKDGTRFTYRVWDDDDLDGDASGQTRAVILSCANRQEKVDQRNQAVAKTRPSEKQIIEAICSFSDDERARTVGDPDATRKLAREIIARRE